MGRGCTLGIHLEHLVVVLELEIATRQREKMYCMLIAAASIVMLEPLNEAAFNSAFFVHEHRDTYLGIQETPMWQQQEALMGVALASDDGHLDSCVRQ
jgi:hypothetical protein